MIILLLIFGIIVLTIAVAAGIAAWVNRNRPKRPLWPTSPRRAGTA